MFVLTVVHLFVSALLFAVVIMVTPPGDNNYQLRHLRNFFTPLYELWDAGFIYGWLPFSERIIHAYSSVNVWLHASMFVGWAALCGAAAAWPVCAFRQYVRKHSPEA